MNGHPFAAVSPALRQLAEAVHSRIVKLAPHLQQQMRWGQPAFVGRGDVASIGGTGKGGNAHVNLYFFHGAQLPNPHLVIEGTGKGMRHIKFHKISDLDRPGVDAAIRAAVAFDQALPARRA